MGFSQKPFTLFRSVRWFGVATAISALAIFLVVEPMRWSLPSRYLFAPLDLYRTGALDYTMCMRVALSREEAERFAQERFETMERVARAVPLDQGICPAAFWPKGFVTQTLGYSETRWPNGMVEGSTGAVFEGGYLYFWSWTQ